VSRLLWLEIDKLTEYITDWKLNLNNEYQLFLQFCKFAYNQVCINHYKISSKDSEQRIMRQLEASSEDIFDELKKQFEMDLEHAEDNGWYILRSDFRKLVPDAYSKMSNKDFSELKKKLFLAGYVDFKSENGKQLTIDGVSTKVYRGIRVRSWT